jgi:GST-like protein
MDRQLEKKRFLSGGEYTIADIATYPWVARHEWHRVDLGEFPNVKRWYDAIGARPAVARGMAVPPLN